MKYKLYTTDGSELIATRLDRVENQAGKGYRVEAEINGHKANSRHKVEQEWRRWQDKVEAGYIPQPPEPQVYNEEQIARGTKIMAPIKIEITRGDMTIKVEMDSYERASKIISDILRGE